MTVNESGRSTLPQLMTLDAAAAQLGCSTEHLRRAIRAKRLACYRYARRTMITPEHLAAFVESTLRPASDPQSRR